MPTPSAVGQALAATSAATPEEAVQPTLQKAIDLLRPQVARALPNTLDPDRFVRIVLTEVRRNPVLQFASQESFLGAVMTAAQLGLEFGPLGYAYLVPFKNKGKQECQLIVGYKGLIDLHLRSGRVKSIVARPVYERDVFKVVYDETGDHLVHEPYLGSDRGPIVRYYGRAVLDDGGSHLEIMELPDISARRNRSKAADSGPWKTDEVAMSCKTVVRKMSPWLPTSPTVAEALEADENVVRLEGSRLVIDRDDTPPGGEAVFAPGAPESLEQGNGNGAPPEAPPEGQPAEGEPEARAEGEAEEEGLPEHNDETGELPPDKCSHGRLLKEECGECEAEEQAEADAAEAAAAASAPAPASASEAAPEVTAQEGDTPKGAAPEVEPPPVDPRESPAEASGTTRSLSQKQAEHILAVVEAMDEARVVEMLRGFDLGAQGNINAKRLRLYQRISEGVIAGEEASIGLI